MPDSGLFACHLFNVLKIQDNWNLFPAHWSYCDSCRSLSNSLFDQKKWLFNLYKIAACTTKHLLLNIDPKRKRIKDPKHEGKFSYNFFLEAKWNNKEFHYWRYELKLYHVWLLIWHLYLILGKKNLGQILMTTPVPYAAPFRKLNNIG